MGRLIEGGVVCSTAATRLCHPRLLELPVSCAYGCPMALREEYVAEIRPCRLAGGFRSGDGWLRSGVCHPCRSEGVGGVVGLDAFDPGVVSCWQGLFLRVSWGESDWK